MTAAPRDPLRLPSAILLSIARVGVGTLFLIRTTVLAAWLDLHVMPRAAFLLGWPILGDPGFGAPFLLPRQVLATACMLRTVAALLFTLGLFTRPAGIMAGVLAYVVASQEPIGFNMTMHVLFLGMFVLAMTDAGNRLALRPVPKESLGSSFGLVRTWVASIYIWAGLAKLNGDWLSGRVLASFLHDGVVHGPIAALILATRARATFLAPALALGEMGVGLLLLARKTRRFGLLAAFTLHASFEATLAPDILGWIMACLLVPFVGAIGSWRSVFAATSEDMVSSTNVGERLRRD